MRGTYILLLECLKDIEISVGSLGMIRFKNGYYAYIGSAMNGLENRIRRHLLKKKRVFWHIDYLTTSEHFNIIKVFAKVSDRKEESDIAKMFEGEFKYINSFGSSDSNDKSHLFIITDLDKFFKIIKSLGFIEIDMKSFAAAER